MVLPEEIGDAAQDADEADVARVKACLASGGDIALRLLLRAGASLDHKARHEAAADGWETVTAEDIIISNYGYNNQDDEKVTAMNALHARAAPRRPRLPRPRAARQNVDQASRPEFHRAAGRQRHRLDRPQLLARD